MPKSTDKLAKKIDKEEDVRYFWDRTETEDRIRSVAKATIDHYINYIFPEAYEIIKQKVLFSADIEYQIKKLTGESNLSHKIYPLIDSTHDAFVANLSDSETTPVIIARTKQAMALKKEAETFYDWAESNSGINEQEDLIGYEASLIGTSYGIYGSRNKEDFEGVDKPLDDQTPTVTEIPSCYHLSFFELFTEIGCVDFYKSRFKFKRKLLTLNQITEMYPNVDFEETRETSEWKVIKINEWIEKTCGEWLYDRDFNRIRQIKDYENIYKSSLKNSNSDRDIFDVGIYGDIFKVVKGEGGIHEVIEYRSGENLVIMVNGYIVYDGDNPYGNIDPFAVVVYEKIPGTYRGRGIGQKLMSLQKEANMLFSSVNNGIKMHLFPDYAISKGSLKEVWGGDVKTLKWTGSKVYEIPQGNALSSEPFKAIHFVEYDVLALANRRLQEVRLEAQEIIGTNSYTQGWQGKVERSASAVSYRVATMRTRLNTIVNSLNVFRQRGFYTWLYIAAVSYPDKLMVRIINKEEPEFLEITPSNLLNKFDILIDRETTVSIRRAEAVANTIQTLNALTPYLVDQNGLPTLDPRDVLEQTLNDSMLSNIKALDLDGVKKMMDMKIDIEQYLSSKVQPQWPQVPQPQEWGMSQDMLNQFAQSIPPEGIMWNPDDL